VEWNPNAISDDEASLGVDRLDEGVAVPDDALLQLDEAGQPAAVGPADPPVQGLDGLAPAAFGDGEHGAQALLERPRPVQRGMGLGDPGQLLTLVLGKVLGVLPQRPPGTFSARPAAVHAARSWVCTLR
jgi:hypothetical protein